MTSAKIATAIALALFVPLSLAQENFSTRPRVILDKEEAARRWNDELGRIIRDKANEAPDAGSKQPRLLKAVAPIYPRQYIRDGIVGEVDARFLVGESGEVLEVRIDGSAHELLTNAVIVALKQWRFEPVIENGTAKQFALRQKFIFKQEP